MLEKVICVRISKSDIQRLKQASSALGIGMADFIRMAVKKELARRGYIPEEEAKGLEV